MAKLTNKGVDTLKRWRRIIESTDNTGTYRQQSNVQLRRSFWAILTSDATEPTSSSSSSASSESSSSSQSVNSNGYVDSGLRYEWKEINSSVDDVIGYREGTIANGKAATCLQGNASNGDVVRMYMDYVDNVVSFAFIGKATAEVGSGTGSDDILANLPGGLPYQVLQIGNDNLWHIQYLQLSGDVLPD